MAVHNDQLLGTPKIVTFGDSRRRILLGALWLNATDPRSVRAEAKESAKAPQIAADLMVIRRGPEEAQFALARRSDGVPPGTIVGAAVAANELAGSWTGAFRIGDGWWCLTVRNDMIVPDADLWFDDEATARKHIQDEINDGGLRQVFAPKSMVPPEWQPKAEELPIAELLAKATSPRLTPVESISPRGKNAIIAVGAIALIGGIVAIVHHNLAEHNRIEEQNRAQIEAIKNRPKYSPPRLWELEPMPATVIKACLDAAETTKRNAPGWDLQKFECGQSGAKGTWARRAGSIEWLKLSFAKEIAKGATVDAQGNNAAITFPVVWSTARGAEALQKSDDVKRAFWSWAQAADDEITLGPKRAVVPPPNVKAEDFVRPDWGPISVVLKTSKPVEWMPVIAGFKGLVLTGMEFDVSNNAWKLKGDAYVR